MTKSDDVVPIRRPLQFGRRQVLIGGAMLAASSLAIARLPQPYAPRVDKQRFISWVPDTVGPWHFARSSGVVLPPPDAYTDRIYDNLITHVYESASGPTIMLLIAYNNVQDGVLQVHRPEICYSVGGYSLTPTNFHTLALANRGIPANTFSALSPDRDEQILYWIRIGSEFPRTWTEQRMAVARANVAGRIPDGAMFRVSLISDSKDAAKPSLEAFAREFLAASPQPLNRLLVGPS
jgi:EpsI family protein